MTSIFLLTAGVTAMLWLWALAWRLWRDADVGLDMDGRPEPRARPIWQNEPTPEHRVSVSPPEWLFDETAVAAPSSRRHPSSTANTCFFTREELEHAAAVVEMTEVLDEDHMFVEGATDDSAPPYTTSLFPGPRA